MTTIRTTYEPIETRRTRAGRCPVCGRPARRTEVFRQTVNPWNRTENDVPKTREEVRASVEAAADAWVPDFRHEQCKGVSR